MSIRVFSPYIYKYVLCVTAGNREQKILRSCNGLYFATARTEDKPSVLPPCFTPSSRKGASAGRMLPIVLDNGRTLPPQPCILLQSKFGAKLQDHVRQCPPRSAFTARNSLWRTSLRTLLFTAFNRCAQENSVFLYTVLFYYIGEGFVKSVCRCSMPGAALKKVLTTAAQRSNIKTY